MVVSQFCTDESVNSLLEYSKLVVDSISLPVSDHKLRSLQYLVFAGMVSYYGFEHIDEITSAFKNYKFLYINEPIPSFLKKQGNVSSSSFGTLNLNTVALFHPVYDFSCRRKSAEGEIILSSYYKMQPDELLENMVHEVNHAVTSINNGISFVNGDKTTRMGIYTKNHESNTRNNYILEESFNVLQAAEITEHILGFSNFNVCDCDIKYSLDSMRYAANKKRNGFGYEDTVGIVRPLYNNSSFGQYLKECRITGNIQNIDKMFDCKAGKNSFQTLSGICDVVSNPTLSRTMVYKKQCEGSSIVRRFC